VRSTASLAPAGAGAAGNAPPRGQCLWCVAPPAISVRHGTRPWTGERRVERDRGRERTLRFAVHPL